jgi:hypothetical protein
MRWSRGSTAVVAVAARIAPQRYLLSIFLWPGGVSCRASFHKSMMKWRFCPLLRLRDFYITTREISIL